MNILYTNGTDRWLSPPDLVEALGPFELDPCCEPWMPWRTARRMLSLQPHGDIQLLDGKVEMASIVPGHEKFTPAFQASEIVDDALLQEWTGRTFLNHPYSNGLPWCKRMIKHGNGISLTAAKSTDTRWGQLMLASCTLSLWLDGRLLFHFPDGTCSKGKWLPNVLWAFGEENAEVLSTLTKRTNYRGVYMKRV